MTQRVKPACPRRLARDRADPTLAQLLARVKCQPGSPQGLLISFANRVTQPCRGSGQLAEAPRHRAGCECAAAQQLGQSNCLHAHPCSAAMRRRSLARIIRRAPSAYPQVLDLSIQSGLLLRTPRVCYLLYFGMGIAALSCWKRPAYVCCSQQ